MEDSRTCYGTQDRTRFERILDPDPPDPNASVPLCRECAKEHHEYWDDMWAEYHSGLM